MNIFQKIIAKEAPANIRYEDDRCMAFDDIDPQAPIHILMVPKANLESLNAVISGTRSVDLMGHMMLKVVELAKQLGLKDSGYRLIINCGKDGGQEVDHLHVHLLGGRKMKDEDD